MDDFEDRAAGNAAWLTERRTVLMGMMAAPAASAMAPAAAMAAEPAGARDLYAGKRRNLQGRTAEQTLQDLTDREEIRELIAIYAHRVAQGVSIADLYTDDGSFILRYPGRPVRITHGREQLDKNFNTTAASGLRPLPMIHNFLLRIDGDSGIGICSNELRMTEDGQSMIGSGFYQDEYRRENGLWRFVTRDMTFIHWVSIQDGWVPQS